MGTLIETIPNKSTEMILIIPAFQEINLLDTLQSVFENQGDFPITEVIILLNHSTSLSSTVGAIHNRQLKEIQSWIAEHPNEKIIFHCPEPIEMQGKHAGVGLARKIAMDEAVRRFLYLKKPHGILLNLDADCLCSPNYLETVYQYFRSPLHLPCVGIEFEHRVTSEETQLNKAIVDYELHLRYYVEAQRYIFYQFAFHTLGSCFAVRAEAYCEQGGMNRRQAGEDFYFLHKFSVIQQLGEIKVPLVFPSSRISDRVPFGTGKAVAEYVKNGLQKTYALESIILFGKVLQQVSNWHLSTSEKIQNDLHSIHPRVEECLLREGIIEAVTVCQRNCASLQAFEKRLLRWLNPFLLMKFLHTLREYEFPDQAVELESFKLLQKLHYELKSPVDSSDLLRIYRERSIRQ